VFRGAIVVMMMAAAVVVVVVVVVRACREAGLKMGVEKARV